MTIDSKRPTERSADTGRAATAAPTDEDAQCTRRAFMRGDWFNDASETSQSTGKDHVESRSLSKRLVPMVAALLAAGVLLLVLTTAGAAAPAGQPLGDTAASSETDQPAASQSCSEPVNLRERAHAQLNELQQLDENDKFVDVPSETMSAIQQQTDRGNSSFDLQEYCEARDAYSVALNLSTIALKDAYRSSASHHLNASAGMLEAERADGNPDPDVGSLQEQLETRREGLSAASGLSELRTQHTRAVEFHQATQQKLPTAPHEQLIEAVQEQQVFAALAAVLGLLKLLMLGVIWHQRGTETTGIRTTGR